MSRQDFLQELALYLNKLPQTDFDEVMAYFTELFDEAGTDGETELMASLGSPQEAAADILDQLLEDSAGAKKKTSSAPPTPLTKERKSQDKQRNHVEKNLPAFDQLDLALSELDVLIMPSLDETFSISYFKMRADHPLPFSYAVVDDCLKVYSLEHQTHQANRISFWGNWNSRNTALSTLVIKVPAGIVFTKAAVSLGCGDLILKKISLTSMHVQVGSGDIELEQIVTQQGKLSTGSGDIFLKECRLRQTTLNTGSGDLELTQTLVEHSQLATASGDVDLVQGSLNSSQITIVSGDVSLSNSSYAGTITITTQSGDIECKGLSKQLSQINLTANTSFGEIDGKRLKNIQTVRDNYAEHVVPNAKAVLLLQSQSGDIDLS
ncbi:DUF4097 family beta strand repeat-containing protein [Streptococcus merionis]|uniref:DUF4097 family beta strand repeat-containing protein n=1 Tax=Streptococcus merionis TaxID=400065 RepID=UPI0026F2A073|nr:DUF4097 family beta strand repeat-containing protein [Streptococcus merionis]